jgi:hypothetical protein
MRVDRFPAFRFEFPRGVNAGLNNSRITPEIAGKILYGGARLYGFTQVDFEKADIAGKRRDNPHASQAQK